MVSKKFQPNLVNPDCEASAWGKVHVKNHIGIDILLNTLVIAPLAVGVNPVAEYNRLMAARSQEGKVNFDVAWCAVGDT